MLVRRLQQGVARRRRGCDVCHRRNIDHQFLGMDIHLNNNKTVSLSMKARIKEENEAYGDDVSMKIATPADRNLFAVNNESEELKEGKSAIFHSVVAKLLHLFKRARPDIEPTVAFLCTSTRVRRVRWKTGKILEES